MFSRGRKPPRSWQIIIFNLVDDSRNTFVKYGIYAKAALLVLVIKIQLFFMVVVDVVFVWGSVVHMHYKTAQETLYCTNWKKKKISINFKSKTWLFIAGCSRMNMHFELPRLSTFGFSLTKCTLKKSWVLWPSECHTVPRWAMCLTDCRVLLIWGVERRVNQGSDSAVSSQNGGMERCPGWTFQTSPLLFLSTIP